MAVETLAGWRASVTVATTANAHSQPVPASAAPAWMPPTWWTFETLQRSHSGHERDPRPARPKSTLRTVCWRMRTAAARFTSVRPAERRQRAAVVDPPVAALEVMRTAAPRLTSTTADDQPVVGHQRAGA